MSDVLSRLLRNAAKGQGRPLHPSDKHMPTIPSIEDGEKLEIAGEVKLSDPDRIGELRSYLNQISLDLDFGFEIHAISGGRIAFKSDRDITREDERKMILLIASGCTFSITNRSIIANESCTDIMPPRPRTYVLAERKPSITYDSDSIGAKARIAGWTHNL